MCVSAAAAPRVRPSGPPRPASTRPGGASRASPASPARAAGPCLLACGGADLAAPRQRPRPSPSTAAGPSSPGPAPRSTGPASPGRLADKLTAHATLSRRRPGPQALSSSPPSTASHHSSAPQTRAAGPPPRRRVPAGQGDDTHATRPATGRSPPRAALRAPPSAAPPGRQPGAHGNVRTDPSHTESIRVNHFVRAARLLALPLAMPSLTRATSTADTSPSDRETARGQDRHKGRRPPRGDKTATRGQDRHKGTKASRVAPHVPQRPRDWLSLSEEETGH